MLVRPKSLILFVKIFCDLSVRVIEMIQLQSSQRYFACLKINQQRQKMVFALSCRRTGEIKIFKYCALIFKYCALKTMNLAPTEQLRVQYNQIVLSGPFAQKHTKLKKKLLLMWYQHVVDVVELYSCATCVNWVQGGSNAIKLHQYLTNVCRKKCSPVMFHF